MQDRRSYVSACLVLVTVLGTAPVLVGCAPEDDKDAVHAADGGPDGSVPEPGVEARFELPASGAPDFLAVPFPSDLYRDGGKIVTIPAFDKYVPNNGEAIFGGLAGLDGFGTTAGALFEIDDRRTPDGPAAALDPSTLPADEKASVGDGASAMLVDLEATDPSKALVPARVDYHDDSELGGKLRPLLVVYPGRGIVLASGHQYAAVVTTGVQTKDKAAIAPSATFMGIADGSKRSSDAEKLYGDALDKVATLVPATKSKVAALAVFTTSTNASELPDLRAQFAKAHETAPPVLKWDAPSLMPMGQGLFAVAEPLPAGYAATLDKWLGTPDKLADTTDDPANDQPKGKGHDAIAAIGTAVFDAPNLLVDSPMGYDDPVHHTFARDAMGKPIVNAAKPTNKIWVTIALPKAAMPATGFPTVIVQHGLGGDRSFLLASANTYAKKGWATVAIESVTFGARALDPANTVDAKAGFAWSAGNYDGPDGLVDSQAAPNDFFGILKSFSALRDQMRQSVLDLGTLTDVLRNPTLDLGPLLLAVPGAKIDPSRIAYMGVSLGGIMGSMFAAIEPHVTTFVLNVPGGGLLTELSNGPIISGYLKFAALGNFGISKARLVPGHPVLQLMQHVVDVGDPLAYAKNMSLEPLTLNGKANPKKNILQIEALWDEWVSNESNEALALAAGFPLAEPSTGARTGVALVKAMPDAMGKISGVPSPDITAVLVQAGPATHGSNLYDRKGNHAHEYPWPRFDQAEPFPTLPAEITVDEPYLPWQATMTTFLEGALGVTPQVPVVEGFPAPALDFDGDGALDAADKAPNDPTMQ